MKFVAFIVGVGLNIFGFWLLGYNFDQRGELAVTLYLTSLIFGGLFALLVPIFKD